MVEDPWVFFRPRRFDFDIRSSRCRWWGKRLETKIKLSNEWQEFEEKQIFMRTRLNWSLSVTSAAWLEPLTTWVSSARFIFIEAHNWSHKHDQEITELGSEQVQEKKMVSYLNPNGARCSCEDSLGYSTKRFERVPKQLYLHTNKNCLPNPLINIK